MCALAQGHGTLVFCDGAEAPFPRAGDSAAGRSAPCPYALRNLRRRSQRPSSPHHHANPLPEFSRTTAQLS